MNLSTLVCKRFPLIVICSFLLAGICFCNSMAASETSCTGLQDEVNPLLQVSRLTQCLDHGQLSMTERIQTLKQRADLFIQLGRQLQALDDFNSALKLNPDDVECYNGRGIAYKRMGDYEQAMTNYARAMELQEQAIARQPVTRIVVHPEPIISTLEAKPLLPVKILADSHKKTTSQSTGVAVVAHNE